MKKDFYAFYESLTPTNRLHTAKYIVVKNYDGAKDIAKLCGWKDPLVNALVSEANCCIPYILEYIGNWKYRKMKNWSDKYFEIIKKCEEIDNESELRANIVKKLVEKCLDAHRSE